MNYTPIQFLMNGLSDSDGQPLEAGKVHFSVAGTPGGPINLYRTFNGKTNPDGSGEDTVISNFSFNLDSLGKALVYAEPNQGYRFDIYDKHGVLVYNYDYISFPEVGY